MKKLAIVQSNYIPWRGYFDLINAVDEFILFDDLQYTRRDWRNRNRIKTSSGVRWLTIPVRVKGRFRQRISEVQVSDSDWAERHWRILSHAYAGARHYRRYAPLFEELYRGCDSSLLSEINHRFLTAACELLGIRTRVTWSSQYHLREGKSERLIGLCEQAGASVYLSGPSARGYLDEQMFGSAGIEVQWMDYSGYPEHRQLFPPFEPAVSIVDLVFNEGPDAPRFLKSFAC